MFLEKTWELLGKSVYLRRMLRNQRLRKTARLWSPFLIGGRTSGPLNNSIDHKRILIATSVGAHLPGTILESMLGVALNQRGAAVDFLLCDGVLPACLDCTLGKTISAVELARKGPAPFLCAGCHSRAMELIAPLGFNIFRYSRFLPDMEKRVLLETAAGLPLKDLSAFIWRGLAVGEHALAGALRFFARGNIDTEPFAEPIQRKYLQAALITAAVMENLLEQEKFDAVLFHHGIYIPQGIVGEVCRKHGIPVINWNPAYRKRRFIFSHHDTYHHTLLNEPVETWENLSWNPNLESQLLDYLKSRWQGTHDWIYFHKEPQENRSKIASEIDLDGSKPTIGLLTNVFWDAQLHYPANAFADMREWVLDTIVYFEKRSDLNLVIRIHPAEIHGSIPSRQPITKEIERAFPDLPPHIRVIPPESQISTYALMEMCNAAIIYGTKTGVELTSMGIPVIVAGEAWIRNKGITLDAKDKADYFSILDRLPFSGRMEPGRVERARKYAFHFFFRRMIETGAIEQKKGWPPYTIKAKSLADFLPGVDPGLDLICRGILEGTPFVYPAEQMGGKE